MRDEIDGAQVAAALLRWYDVNARVLPWRIPPQDSKAGVLPDPYHVWLSEVMLQQTTVAAVKDYFHRFTQRWPTVQALAAAEDADVMAQWAGLGYYARARNLIACARVVAKAGAFPRNRAELAALPGIGVYTSAAIAAIAFGAAETVVDGNVERVVSRLFAEDTPLPAAKPVLTRLTQTLTPAHRAGDFAQAMMDLGATVCTPRNPRCPSCPVAGFCAAQALGIAATLPRKAARKPKPVRKGLAYVAVRTDGAVLLETRPAKGLLGGMPGWPGSDWCDNPQPAPPVHADWVTLPGTVTHVFTHFHLELTVLMAQGATGTPNRGAFHTTFNPDALPSVMRKVWDHAQHTDLFATSASR